MALIVQKFGGSSVADAERIFRVAGRITKTYAAGNDVVVVLSAQGDTTDDLIAKAEEINPNASRREMDMLLACGEHAVDRADGDGDREDGLSGGVAVRMAGRDHDELEPLGRAHPACGLRPRAAGAGSEADRAGGWLPGR